MNTLLLETDARCRIITINRPTKLNALNAETLGELRQALADAAPDDGVDVIIITGAGEKAFVAGADIAELSQQDALRGREFAVFGQGVFSAIAASTKPVLAAVNGFALGGGCELALACHVRIAAENARFGQPEVNLGVIPGYGGTQRLARIVGYGRAIELVVTGRLIDAAEAYRIGLANALVPAGQALQAARELAAQITARSRTAVRLAMEALRAVPETGLDEGLSMEAALFGIACGSADFREGTAAFLEKRPAAFTGR
jgi:enoyl-CoA hydratase